jgi:hypothetical protein
MKEDGIGGKCSTHGFGNAYIILAVKPKGKEEVIW